jgi:hypothetical protein
MSDAPRLTQAEIEVYRNIGLCITEWASVETQLFCLCSFALQISTQRVAIIYYRTPTIDARLSLTDELVRTALPQRQKKNGGHDPAIVKEWAGIVSDCRALLPIRNHLAHWPIVKGVHLELSKEKSGQTVRILSKKEMIEISMGLAEIHRGNDGKDPIKPTDLPGYHRRVAAIRKALMSFYQKISAMPPQ